MKKGSALLVVLGMLSFMLISAVAFSAYMRYARLPSSFLRRSSASRMLAKAALAEAIDEIDAAIGNNPHPGIGTQAPRRGAGSLAADLNGIQNEDTRTRNHWKHRVYIGTNELHQADDTVSTLTLEGLAYIPPALVNEARYYSRRSQAGIWRPLGFDSGRYAFCAIDVSDQFDVNALSAKIPRNSSPGGRISLAYLFEGEGHTDYGDDPKEWDKFLESDVKVRQMSMAEADIKNQDVPPADATHVPFVSIADLNLAIHDKKPLKWESPFCRFLESGGDFYTGVGATDPTGGGADKVKRQSFVTDSLFPQPSAALASKETDLCDLSNFDEQPFDELAMLSDTYPLDWFETDPGGMKTSAKRIANKTSAFGLAALYDYLDANNIPISLAMPTTERAPMICGIGTENMGGAQLKLADVDVKKDASDEAEGSRTMTWTTTYKLDGEALAAFLDSGTFKVVLAYPFRRGVDLAPALSPDPFKFALEGQLAVFFYTDNEEPVGFRDGGDPRDKNAQLRAAPEWFTDAATFDKGVLRVPLKFEAAKDMTFRNVLTEEDAVIEQDCILSQSEGAKAALVKYLEDHPLLTVTEEWKQTKTTDAMGNVSWTPENPPEKSLKSAISDISVMHPGGNEKVMGNLANKDYSLKKNLVVASAVWLRVKNGIDKTVDLVPASVMDDNMLNGGNSANAALIADAVGKTPLMLTRANPMEGNALKSLVVSVEDLKDFTDPIPLDFTMNVQCIDPRWNWAPEHWYKCNGSVNKKTWLDAAHDFLDSDDSEARGRDNDIFLMTSDAGYMQSVYELAFLPRFTDLRGTGNNQVYGNMETLGGTISDFETNPEQVKNRHLMWRSYHPYQMDLDAAAASRDPFEDLKIVNDGGGFRINPYSEDLNVLMGAFANTPVDWWAASLTTGNSLAQGKGLMRYISENEKLDAETFNDHYAFNQISPDAANEGRMFVWEELEQVARNFRELIRKHVDKGSNVSSDPWMDVFDGVAYNDRPTGSAKDSTTMSVGNPLDLGDYMNWDNDITFCGANIPKLLGATDRYLYDVDRKFLYGYWRECFAAKQQLFLVFVRAEPMMMGGGAVGVTPPQLGARAVALVWRDPTKSPDDQTPHRTRVLFYRQFD